MQIFKLDACREKMSCLKYPIITRVELFTSPHQRIRVFCVKLHKEKLFWYFVWQGHIRWVMPFHQKYFVWWWKLNFYFLIPWKIIGCLFTLSFDKYTGVKFIQIETIYLFYVHFKYTSQIEVHSKWYLQWIEYSEYQL